jgi:3-oxoacyl-[acyl-carrier protein] reductase
MIRLDGRVAVVTGASRGIGAALARSAATAGAKVVFSYLSGIAEAEALATDINADRPAAAIPTTSNVWSASQSTALAASMWP